MIDINDLEAIGMGPPCPKCGDATDWLRCWKCGGEGYHELYDEDPLWYDEDDIETCDVCMGHGGWWRCWDCKECFDRLPMRVYSILRSARKIRVGDKTWMMEANGVWQRVFPLTA